MDEEETYQQSPEPPAEPAPNPGPRPANRLLWLITAALLCATLISFGYVSHERHLVNRLSADKQQMSAALDQAKTQLDALTQKVDALSAPKAAEAAEAPVETTKVLQHQRIAARHRSQPRPRESPAWKKMQARLDAQQKQLDATQQDVARARSDLEGELNSAKGDLGNSIARNHDELVALERRGERNYFEFDLRKSKQFEKAGPLSLSLRKANTKKQNFDMTMLVNDYKLEKKHVNLYEPVIIYPEGSHQTLELVVNRITKNEVRGYVSTPKSSGQETIASAASEGSNGQATAAGTASPQVNAGADKPPALSRRPNN